MSISRKHSNYTSLLEAVKLTKGLCVKNTDDISEGSVEPKLVCRFSESESFDVEDSMYKIGEPFEKLSKLMFDVYKGKIKKRVIQKGTGPIISADATVTLEYKTYLECQDLPCDATGGPLIIALSGHHHLPGLSMALQSMKVGEISQFLLNSQFAYGEHGWLNLPPVTVLFVIEIRNVVRLNDKKKSFRDAFIVANASLTRGNEFYSKGLLKLSIKEYKSATSELEICKISNNSDLEKQHKLLLRLYTNLVVVYTKLQEPGNACTYSQYAYDMCRATNLIVPVKVYINHARSLILLNDLKPAEILLYKAKRLDPLNREITKEIFNLETLRTESPNTVVPVKSICLSKKPVEISKQFKEAMTQYCVDLLHDGKTKEYELPEELSSAEQEFALGEMQRHGLYFKQRDVNGVFKFYISKNNDFW